MNVQELEALADHLVGTINAPKPYIECYGYHFTQDEAKAALPGIGVARCNRCHVWTYQWQRDGLGVCLECQQEDR